MQCVAQVMEQLRGLDDRQRPPASLDAATVFLERIQCAGQVDRGVQHIRMNRQDGLEQLHRSKVLALPHHREAQVDVELRMLLRFGIVDRLDMEDDRLVEHLHLLEMDRKAVQQFPVTRPGHHGGGQILDAVAQFPCRARQVPRSARRSASWLIDQRGVDLGARAFQVAARQQDRGALLEVRQLGSVGRHFHGHFSRHSSSPDPGTRPVLLRTPPARGKPPPGLGCPASHAKRFRT